MTSTCQTIQPLLSEFLDDRLDAQTAWQVQTHAAGCEDCARMQRELSALRAAFRTLPVSGPSAGFDAALAQRLALTRRPAPAPAWRGRLASFWVSFWVSFCEQPARMLRPALALGAAGAAAIGLFFLPSHTTPPAPLAPPAVSQAVDPASVDRAFVADCVAQRRREAVGEPLADLSAQNLAGHLDAGTASPERDTSAPDAGMF